MGNLLRSTSFALALVGFSAALVASASGCGSSTPETADNQCKAKGYKCVSGVENTKLVSCAKCVAPAPIGAACEESFGNEDTCDATGFCPTAGTPDAGAKNVCVPKRNGDEPCAFDRECGSLKCTSGKCQFPSR